MIWIIKTLNESSSTLVDLSLLEISFVIRILVLAKSSQLVLNNQDSYTMRLLIDEIFYYFCLEFSLSLILAIGLRVQLDQDFRVPDCLVIGSLVVVSLLLSKKLLF